MAHNLFAEKMWQRADDGTWWEAPFDFRNVRAMEDPGRTQVLDEELLLQLAVMALVKEGTEVGTMYRWRARDEDNVIVVTRQNVLKLKRT